MYVTINNVLVRRIRIDLIDEQKSYWNTYFDPPREVKTIADVSQHNKLSGFFALNFSILIF